MKNKIQNMPKSHMKMSSKVHKEEMSKEGCELKQLGNTEVFYCPEHTGMVTGEAAPPSENKDMDEMIDYQMKK